MFFETDNVRVILESTSFIEKPVIFYANTCTSNTFKKNPFSVNSEICFYYVASQRPLTEINRVEPTKCIESHLVFVG